jgi:TonB family protein
MTRFTLAFGVLALAGAIAAAPAPAAQANWIADWGVDRCTLVQKAEGERPAIVAMERQPASGVTTLTLLDPAWKTAPVRRAEELELVVEPSGRAFAGVTPVTRVGGPALQVSRDDSGLSAELPRMRAVSLRRGGTALLTVPVAGAAKAAAALRECEDALLRDWGVDPAAYAALRTKPEPLQADTSLISEADYPPDARRARAMGTTGAVVLVGADGRLAKCLVTSSSGNASLDAQTCRLLTERARFTPALDRSGRKVVAPFAVSVGWALPEEAESFKPDY